MLTGHGDRARQDLKTQRLRAAIEANQKAKSIKGGKNVSVLSKIDGLINGRPPRFALVRTLGGLGDALMVTPTFKALKEKYPDCHITYGTTKEYSGGVLFDILKNNPYIDELVPFQQVKKESFDIYADLTAIGVRDEYIIDAPKDRQTMWGNYIGIDIDDGKCVYVVEEDERKWAKEWLEDHKKTRKSKFIVIQPGSYADRRNWPRDTMVDFIKKMHRHDDSLVFLIHDYLVGEYKDTWSSLPNSMNISEFNIRNIAALMEQSDLVIAHDSGLLHLAGALDCKIVSIFGSTHPKSRINWFKNCIAVWQKNLACAPCVVGESRVLTTDGYKDIDEIVVDDIVKTVDGEYNKVTKIHKNDRKDRDLIELSYVGSNAPITVTNDHKMLVSKNRLKVFRKKDYTPNPEWTESKDINKKDFLCLPRNKEQKVELKYDDPDMFWLYGLYIAEGYTHHRKTVKSRSYYTAFTVSKSEAETVCNKVKELSDKYFGGNSVSITNNRDGSSKVSFACKEFTEHIIRHFGKNKAINKYIPSFIFKSSDKNLKAFVDGAMFGDGYSPEKGEHVYTTASRDLAYGFQELYTRFGTLARVYERKRDTNYKKNTTIYRVYIGQEFKSTRWFADDDYIYAPVKEAKISDRKDEFVYDITVENSTTFTIDNVATWDCWYRACKNHYYCMKALPIDDVFNATMFMLDEWKTDKRNDLSRLENVDYFYGLRLVNNKSKAIAEREKKARKRPEVFINSMKGLGDNVYQRTIVKELCAENDVYITTPWPELYADLANVYFVKEETHLRTQKKNISYQIDPVWVDKVPTTFDQKIEFSYEQALVDGRTILSGMETNAGISLGKNITMDVPRYTKHRIKDIDKDRKIAVIRPASVRVEWDNAARNPKPEYLLECSQILKERGYFVISLADLSPETEKLVEPDVEADIKLYQGEMTVTEIIALLKMADIAVGGIGWLLPMCLATKTPLFAIYGGCGGHNMPTQLVDDRLDSRFADEYIYHAIPKSFCLCKQHHHNCDKTITQIKSKFKKFLDIRVEK